MSSMLDSYGWSDDFARSFEEISTSGPDSPTLHPGRVVASQRGVLRLQTADGARDAVVAGGLRHHAYGADALPVVGDWVAFDLPDPDGMARIEAVLPRRTRLSRKTAGERAVEQVLVANVDRILIVTGLDGDYNLRRIERFLVMVRESGAEPAVILNKLDQRPDWRDAVAEAQAVAPGVPVVAVTALAGDLAEVEALIAPGETAALVGSSGVGKSTLVNRLLDSGEPALRTAAVREGDDRGRHTTTHRELFRLPDGGLLIDNPGVREIQLWDAADGLSEAFADIEALAAGCRFRDCSHSGEPGCAVQAAIDDGRLDPSRLDNLRAMEAEAAALELRRDVRARREAERKTGRFYKSVIAEKNKRRRGR